MPCIGWWILIHCATREVQKVRISTNMKKLHLFLDSFLLQDNGENSWCVCVCVFPRCSPHNGRIFDNTVIGNFFILFPGHMTFSRLPCDLVSVLSGLAWLRDLDWFPNATKTGKPLAQGTVMNSCQKQGAWGRGQKARERQSEMKKCFHLRQKRGRKRRHRWED